MISGEHGIGITKLEYLTDDELAPFAALQAARSIREGRFNRGKLLRDPALPADLSGAYTPSFSLIGHESLILEQSDIGGVADSIKDCLRCGKCKPVCATHVPRANLLYSPRNKILATSLLIEAFLYEEQTRRGVSLRHFDEFGDVADHCTVCHKCANPCPVDIDFGDVSIAMRNLLRKRRHAASSIPAPRRRCSSSTRPTRRRSSSTKKLMIDWGYKAQRLAYRLAQGDRRSCSAQTRASAADASASAPLKAQVIHFINKPMPGGLPKRTSRALLDIEDDAIVPIIRDPARSADDADAVFYFPGLRLGAAVLAGRARDAGDALPRRRADGAAAGLPVLRLSADRRRATTTRARRSRPRNRVLFHRVANTLNYLDIKTVIVSCGTCMDQLQKYEFDKIFPGCRLLDIHEYLMEKGVTLDGVDGHALHVPRPLPHADEDLRAAGGRQRADGRRRSR